MDLQKTGEFIASCRKEKGLTQEKLAQKLFISEKAVSKWECGKSFPDTSILLPLCECLGINVNELLSGKHLDGEEYAKNAEENLMNVMKEKEHNRKTIVLSMLVVFATLLSCLSLILVAGLVELETWLRVTLIVIALVVLIIGILVACALDHSSGYFECRHCHARFVPTFKSYIIAPHGFLTRQLKCPKCGKVSYCRKRLTKEN